MPLVTTEVHDRVAVLTLDDPDKRNAVTLAMNDEIIAALDEWESDDGIGALVVTGAPPAFLCRRRPQRSSCRPGAGWHAKGL